MLMLIVLIVFVLAVFWVMILRRERTLSANAGRVQAALASGNLGFWDWDVQNNSVFWDERMALLYDCSPREKPQRIEDWRGLIHEDDGGQAWEEWQAAARGEREYDTEFRVVHKNGAVKVIKANAMVVRDRKGTAVCMVGLNRDITEQRWAEHEIVSLNESLERRVAERTRQLETANERLRAEIDERIVVERTLKNHSAQLKMFSSRLMKARESERRHIAHELHDEIGQELTGLKLGLDRLRRSAGGTLAGELRTVQEQVEGLMSRARDLAFNLRPSLLDDLGLAPALQWLFRRYTEQTGVTVEFRGDKDGRRFSPEIEITLFRVIQEALTNVARHAGVNSVFVSLAAQNDAVVARVEDQGNGFQPDDALKSGATLGLTGIRERVEDAGGSVELWSEQGKGTRLTVSIPLLRTRRDAGGRTIDSCA